MSNLQTPIQTRQEKCRLVEVIGPAGAGKTSLFTALGESSGQIRLSDIPDLHKLADMPFFIRYGLQLAPNLVRYSTRSGRHFTRREFAWMSMLIGWPNLLQRQFEKSTQVVILDQGPVYLLAEMREFGPDNIRGIKAETFWQKLYERWAQTLDMIVWLDADNASLLERIRTRAQDHIVKNETSSKVVEFIECYRRIFDTTVAALQFYNPHLRVIRFDTGKQRTNEIRDEILLAVGDAE